VTLWQHFGIKRDESTFLNFKNTTMSSSKLLAGILVGAAAGAVLGILFAPDKGSETRKKIVDTTGDLGDNLKTKFSEMTDSLKEKYESIRGDANDILQKGKSYTEDVKNDFV
jgi:gas vesicle protein